MQIKLKGRDITEAITALTKLGERELHRKLAYIVAKNLRLLKIVVSDLNDSLPEVEQDRSNKFTRSINKLQAKSREGSPADKVAQMTVLQKEVDKLEEEYSDIIEQKDTYRKAELELLDGDFDVEVHAIPAKLMPEEFAPSNLGPMIDAVLGWEDEDEEPVRAEEDDKN